MSGRLTLAEVVVGVVVVALSLLVVPGRAAEKGAGAADGGKATDKAGGKPAESAAASGNLIGTWVVTGPGIGKGKVTMEFDAPDRLMVVRLLHGDSGTMSPGPQWKLSADHAKLTFADTLAEDNIVIEGTWSLAWDGPDKVAATTGKGKKYQLAREAATESKPAASKTTNNDKAADKPATAGDLIGTWTLSGPGLEGFKATLEFVKPDTLSLVRVGSSKGGGDVRSQSSGPTWKLSGGGNTIAFQGSLSADNFKIKGDWSLAWDGPDKFTATTGKGKVYHLERVKAK
jgi:hypothetical protein